MKDERSTSEREPLAALEVVDRENAVYRRHRIEDVFFPIGMVAAIASSILKWPLHMWMLSAVAFAVWVLSLIIYSETYMFLEARSFSEVLSRLRDERREVKCILLFVLPMLCRLGRIFLIALLAK